MKQKKINIDEFLQIADDHIKTAYGGSFAECARHLRISASNISKMFTKVRPPTKEFLADVGYEVTQPEQTTFTKRG